MTLLIDFVYEKQTYVLFSYIFIIFEMFVRVCLYLMILMGWVISLVCSWGYVGSWAIITQKSETIAFIQEKYVCWLLFAWIPNIRLQVYVGLFRNEDYHKTGANWGQYNLLLNNESNSSSARTKTLVKRIISQCK